MRFEGTLLPEEPLQPSAQSPQDTVVRDINETGAIISGQLGDTRLGQYYQLRNPDGSSRLDDALNKLSQVAGGNSLDASALHGTFLEKLKGKLCDQNGNPLTREALKTQYQQDAKVFPGWNVIDTAMREVMREKILPFAGLDRGKLGEFSGSLRELLDKKDLKDEDIARWLLGESLPEAGKLEKIGDWFNETGLGHTAKISGRAFCFLVASGCLSFAASCHMVAFLMTGEEKYLEKIGHTIRDSVTLLGHPVKKIMQDLMLDVGKRKELAIDLYLATGQGAWGKRSYERLSVSERLEKCNRVAELHRNGGFEASALNLRGISGLERENLKPDFVKNEMGKLEKISASIRKSAEALSSNATPQQHPPKTS